MSTQQRELSVHGSSWMSVSNIISCALVVLAVIPWYRWMGRDGNAANGLFQMGFLIYGLFLIMSLFGIREAVANQTARYNYLYEYKTSWNLFVKALQAAAVLGVLFCLVLYFAAPFFAKMTGDVPHLVSVIRAMSFGIIAVPCISVICGYFQGYQNLKPFALACIIGQIMAMFFLIFSGFVIMEVVQGSYTRAVTQSALAPMMGMLGALGILLFFLKKYQLHFETYIEHSVNRVEISWQTLLKETALDALPLMLVGAGIILFKWVDIFSFLPVMKHYTNYSQEQLMELFAIFSANPDKVILLSVAGAATAALSGLPKIKRLAMQEGDPQLGKAVSNQLQLYAFVMIPAALGMLLLAHPLHTLFFGADSLGAKVLMETIITGIFIGLFLVVSGILLGAGYLYPALKYLVFGLLAKIILQVPLIRLLEVYGPSIATILGLTVVICLMIRKLRKVTRFNFKLTWRRWLLVLLLALFAFVFAIVTRQLCQHFLDRNSAPQAFLIILITSLVGAFIYLYLAMKIRFWDKLLGEKGKAWRKQLRIR